ncbi:hypothetical protein G9A89_023772 [Geosiphon pyriformis]|nr:hypothetical protein G9A89_023772 [Geosiphon pyriformis]
MFKPHTPTLKGIIRREILPRLHLLYMHLRFRRLGRNIAEPYTNIVFFLRYSQRISNLQSPESSLKIPKILKVIKSLQETLAVSGNQKGNQNLSHPSMVSTLIKNSIQTQQTSQPTKEDLPVTPLRTSNDKIPSTVRNQVKPVKPYITSSWTPITIASETTHWTPSSNTGIVQPKLIHPFKDQKKKTIPRPGAYALPVIFDKELREKAITYEKAENSTELGPTTFRALAFLGDSLVYSEFAIIIREIYPKIMLRHIGVLRSQLATRAQLAKFSRLSGLDKIIKNRSGLVISINNVNILGEAMEAYIAAVYLNRGSEEVRDMCRVFVSWFIEENEEKLLPSLSLGKTDGSLISTNLLLPPPKKKSLIITSTKAARKKAKLLNMI